MDLHMTSSPTRTCAIQTRSHSPDEKITHCSCCKTAGCHCSFNGRYVQVCAPPAEGGALTEMIKRMYGTVYAAQVGTVSWAAIG